MLPQPPEWLLEDAADLYRTAKRLGWSVDGAPGFIYTVDWDGEPIIRDRPHWVAAEAIAAAGCWGTVTDESGYFHDVDAWNGYAQTHLVDHDRGSWHHERDSSNQPAYTMWSGKPDTYHALNGPLSEARSKQLISAHDAAVDHERAAAAVVDHVVGAPDQHVQACS